MPSLSRIARSITLRVLVGVLQMGSQSGFAIQAGGASHDNPGTGNRVSADSPTSVHSHRRTAAETSPFMAPKGRERFKAAGSHWEEGEFAGVRGPWLPLSHCRGHGSESIHHNGASAGVGHRGEPSEGNEWRDAKLGCLSGQLWGRWKGGRCVEKMEGGKQFFGLLRSCYSTPN